MAGGVQVTLIQGYDFYGLDAWALRLLIEKGLAKDEDLEGWRRLKIARLQEQLHALSASIQVSGG